MIDPRTATEAAFREAVARLGFPASDDEVRDLWRMARDLLEQAAALRAFVGASGGRPPFGAPAGGGRRPA
jgi:hypothetical protein